MPSFDRSLPARLDSAGAAGVLTNNWSKGWAGGTDHAAFVSAGAPATHLNSLEWSYFNYTWHTNRDTFDKINMDDLKKNATLTAMLAYLVAEQSENKASGKKETLNL